MAARKTRNINVDVDLIVALEGVADRLYDKLGFRPTLSQCIRHLIAEGAGIPITEPTDGGTHEGHEQT